MKIRVMVADLFQSDGQTDIQRDTDEQTWRS